MEVLNHAGLDHLIHKISDSYNKLESDIGKGLGQRVENTINITHSELVSLRDSAQLMPGQQYRITDYVTTTRQMNTRSKEYPFDIIVTALDTCTLSEEARATNPSIDSHFIGSTVTLYGPNQVNAEFTVGEMTYVDGNPYYVLANPNYSSQTKIVSAYINVNNGTIEFGNVYTLSGDGTMNFFANVVDGTCFKFKNSNINAWKLNYCINNDVTRFSWAADGNTKYYLTMAGLTDEIKITNGPSTGYSWYKFEQVTNPNNFVWAKTSTPDYNTVLYNTYFSPGSEKEEYIVIDAHLTVDNTLGKGVIYYMKDEHGNEAPYDFKNIQFKRWQVTSSDSSLAESLGDIENKYVGIMQTDTFENYMPTYLTIPDSSDYKWFYTFSYVKDGVISDLSIEPYVCEHNIIEQCSELNSPQKLNNIVIGGSLEGIHKNKFEPDCFCMTIGDAFSSNSSCFSNTFGQYSRANIFLGTVIQQNIFGENLAVNLCVGGMSLNSISSYFQSNKVLNNFTGNKIGIKFTHNVIHGEFNQNVFSTYASNNTFYDSIKFNTFGGQTNYNTLTAISQCRFGFGFQHNIINYMVNTTVEALFQNNNFARVTACTFGNGCRYNTSKLTNDTSGETRPYLQGCCFGNYVWYTNLYNSTEGSSSAPIKCITITSYFQGSESEYAHIEVPTNSSSEIKVARNSQGDIKVYCEADLIA